MNYRRLGRAHHLTVMGVRIKCIGLLCHLGGTVLGLAVYLQWLSMGRPVSLVGLFVLSQVAAWRTSRWSQMPKRARAWRRNPLWGCTAVEVIHE